MNVLEVLEEIVVREPELENVVAVYLPDTLVLGSVGGSSALDNEPLARACHRCFTGDAASIELEEHLWLGDAEIFVFERSARDPRIALAIRTRSPLNVSWLLSSARRAMERLDNALDVAALSA